jgi:Tol biopolymer transport system component
MQKLLLFTATVLLTFLIACNNAAPTAPNNGGAPGAANTPPATDNNASLQTPQERHFANIKQLTFGGENAEAYWSGDSKKLIMQSTFEQYKCDQIFTINVDGSEKKLVSTGKGRTTCSYYFPDGQRILFASTHAANPDCPTPPDHSQGYVWQINKDYEIYTAKPDGTDLQPLAPAPGYDAEATISPDGKKIVFTSMRDGDLDVYVMDADGQNIKRLTNTPGYDGGAFFSPDGKQIVFRASRPTTEEEIKEYKGLLDQGLVKPSKLEIFIMNVDGSEQRQLTNTGKANFCPFFTPDGRQIIFSSNMKDPKNRDFDLFMMNADDGTALEQITFSPDFDGFPMFSPDGKKIVWASNRNGKARGETNIFVADWVQ